MYKCENCGQEFDSNFCPNCGQKRQTDKICPDCGTLLKSTVRFCPDCGHPFVAPGSVNRVEEVKNKIVSVKAEPQAKTPQLEKADKSVAVGKICAYLKYAPAVVFALFAILLFAFFAGAVAVMAGGEIMGEKIPSESLGNIYTAYSGKSLVLADVQPAATALIILAVFGFILAAVILFVRFKSFAKYKQVRLFGKTVSLNCLLECLSFVFYFIFFVTGCVICGKISSIDGGAEMIKAGACPVCLIVFSLIFALLSAGAMITGCVLCKKFPEAVSLEKVDTEKYSAEKADTAAQIPMPCPPQQVEEVQKPAPPKFAKKIIQSKRATGLFAIMFALFASMTWVMMLGIGPHKNLNFTIQICFLCSGVVSCIVIILIGACSPVKDQYNCSKIYSKGVLIASIIFIVLAFFASCWLIIEVSVDVAENGFSDWHNVLGDWVNLGSGYYDYDVFNLAVTLTAVFFAFGFTMFIYGLVALKRIKKAKKNEQFNYVLNCYFKAYEVYENYKKQKSQFKKQVKIYKTSLALYEKGTDYRYITSFKKWIYTHKAVAVLLAIVAVVGIILAIALPPALNPAESLEDFLSLY